MEAKIIGKTDSGKRIMQKCSDVFVKIVSTVFYPKGSMQTLKLTLFKG